MPRLIRRFLLASLALAFVVAPELEAWAQPPAQHVVGLLRNPDIWMDVGVDEEVRLGFMVGDTFGFDEAPVALGDGVGEGSQILTGQVRSKRSFAATFEPRIKMLRIFAPREHHELVVSLQIQASTA